MKSSGPASMRDCRKYVGNVWRFRDFYKKELTGTSASCSWRTFFNRRYCFSRCPHLLPALLVQCHGTCPRLVSQMCPSAGEAMTTPEAMLFYASRLDFVFVWQLHLSKPVSPVIDGQAPSFAPADCRSQKAWDQLHVLHGRDRPQPILFEASKQANKQTDK